MTTVRLNALESLDLEPAPNSVLVTFSGILKVQRRLTYLQGATLAHALCEAYAGRDPAPVPAGEFGETLTAAPIIGGVMLSVRTRHVVLQRRLTPDGVLAVVHALESALEVLECAAERTQAAKLAAG